MTAILGRARQIGMKIEAVVGTEETLAPADYAGNHGDIEHTLSTAKAERNLSRPSLSRAPSVKGQQMQSIRGTSEFVGGSVSAHSAAGTSIQGMSYAAAGLKVISVGSVTGGTFKIGKTIGNNATEGSATKTGTFVRLIPGSPNKLVYVPGTGAFASSDVIYGYDTPQPQATASSAPSDAGWRYRPVFETGTFTPTTLTIDERLGGERHTIVAARGDGGLDLRVNEPLRLRWDFKGCPVLAASGAPRAGAYITGIPTAGAAPAPAKSMPVIIRHAGTDYKLTMTEVIVAFGNVVEPDPTVNDDDFVGSGYKSAVIGDRRPTMTMNPLRVLPAFFDAQALYKSGATVEVIYEYGGSPAATNGLVIVHAPAAQRDQDSTFADRNGQTVDPFAFELTGDNENELFIYHIFVP